MTRFQRTALTIPVAVAVALSGAPAALAAPGSSLRVAPAAPTLKTPITVTWRADRKLPAGFTYHAEVKIDGGGTLACASYARSARRRAALGRTFTTTLKPPAANGGRQWCPGTATISVQILSARGGKPNAVARTTRTIRIGKGETRPAKAFVPAKITVLGGSAMTVTAAGHADRSSPLTGTLRGRIPGRFKPNTDVPVRAFSGALQPTALAADPLCPGTTPAAMFNAASVSKMTLFANGDARLDLVLNGSASQLIGCGPAGPLAGTTTIPLTGVVGPKGLLHLQISGSTNGIALPGGAQGTLAITLQVNVDLSGRD